MSLNVFLTARKLLGFNGSAPENLGDGNAGAFCDNLGAVWTRDYQSQPAQSITVITPSGTAFASQNPVVTFRALRFDSAGSVTFNIPGTMGITRTVAAGEVWNVTSNAITAVTSYTGGLDGLG